MMPRFRNDISGAPYNGSDYGHYMSITGYDPISSTVLIMNPHYGNAFFGIYAIEENTLFSNMALFYYADTNLNVSGDD